MIVTELAPWQRNDAALLVESQCNKFYFQQLNHNLGSSPLDFIITSVTIIKTFVELVTIGAWNLEMKSDYQCDFIIY